MFAPYSPIFQIPLAERQEEGEEGHRQLRNLMRLTQTQNVIRDEAELRAKKNYFRSNVKLSIISWYYIMILC